VLAARALRRELPLGAFTDGPPSLPLPVPLPPALLRLRSLAPLLPLLAVLREPGAPSAVSKLLLEVLPLLRRRPRPAPLLARGFAIHRASIAFARCACRASASLLPPVVVTVAVVVAVAPSSPSELAPLLLLLLLPP
jgi:hypothetical protein